MAEVAVPLAIAAVTTALRFALQPEQPDLVSEGPRLNDLQATTSNYGDPIPRHFGTVRSGGTIVWARTTEVKRVEKREVGGKGGGGQDSTTIQYEYFSSFAVQVGKGVAVQLLRVWADQKIIFDKTTSTSGVDKYKGMRIRFYPGTLSQAQDPTIVADKGLPNTPAYRDRALVVFENMPLRDFGNRVPSISVEVAYVATTAAGPFILNDGSITASGLTETPHIDGFDGGSVAVDRSRGVMFVVSSAGMLQRVNLKTMTVDAQRTVGDAFRGQLAVDPRSGDVLGMWDNIGGVATPLSIVRLDGRTLDVIFQRPSDSGESAVLGAYAFLPEVELQIDKFGPGDFVLQQIGLFGLSEQIVVDWGAFFGVVTSGPRFDITRLAGLGQAGANFVPGDPIFRFRRLDLFGLVADKNGVWWGAGDISNATSLWGPWGILARLEMKASSTGLEFRPTALWRLCRNEAQHSAASPTADSGALDAWPRNTSAIGLGYDADTHSLMVAAQDNSFAPDRVLVRIDVAGIEGEPELLLPEGDEDPFDNVTDVLSNNLTLRNALLESYVDTAGHLEVGDVSAQDFMLRNALRIGPDNGEIIFTSGETTISRWEWGNIAKGPVATINIDDFNGGAWSKFFDQVLNDTDSIHIWLGEEDALVTRILTQTSPSVVRRWVKLFLGRSTVTDADLGQVVEAIATSTDLSPADINRDELNGKPVRGFSISGNSSARQALYQLSQAFFFDMAESGSLLKFLLRDRAKLLDIESGRTGAVSETPSDRQVQIEESRVPDEDLPLSAEVTYSDPELDYQHGHQSYQRVRVPAKSQFARSPSKIEFPLVLDKTSARNVAYTTVYERWAARNPYQLAAMHRYLELDPGDVVDVKVIREDDSIRTLSARVTQAQVGASLLLELGLESYDRGVYTQAHFGSVGSGVPDQIILTGLRTEHLVLDMPALRSKDIPVFNGTMTVFNILHTLLANDAAWQGGVLLRSGDGIAFEPVDARTQILGWGKVASPAATTIAADPDFTTFHDEQPLDVKMVVGGAQLSSVAQSVVLAGAENIAVIGREGAWEIIGFTTVTPLGGDVYRLTGLLRGQRGTNYLSEAGHGVGSTFILLQPQTLINEQFTFDERTTIHNWYRSDTISARNREGFPRPNILKANQLRCWPVDSVGVAGDLGTDLTITWVRRTFDSNETPTDPGGFGVVQLPGVDQDLVTGGIQRAYDIEIVNALTGAVIRTLTSTAESVAYTAAQRMTDGLNTTGATFTIRIYQYTKFGSTTHRGFPKSKTVSPFVLGLVPYGNDARRKRFFLSTE